MSKLVLVVEDSPTVRKSLVTLIESAGHDVLSANNGKEALDIIESTDRQISMMVSDINMPHMDGLTLLKAMFDAEIKIPTILLTTESSSDLVKKAKSYGAKGWLVKPFKGDQILATISKLAL